MPRKIAAGNWKMNGLTVQLDELQALALAHPDPGCAVWIAPPATLLSSARATIGDAPIGLGGQTCHHAASGAHTGDVSAAMLADAGASFVIVGHSERRQDHDETSSDVAAQAEAAFAADLTAVICIGETEAQRDGGETLAVIAEQLAGSIPDAATAETTVIAYEPVWAIGTGRVPDPDQIAEVHDFIRAALQDRFGADVGGGMSLLYGGSVKGSNAEAIFAVSNVDGALVGGASLKASDFSPIVTALSAAT